MKTDVKLDKEKSEAELKIAVTVDELAPYLKEAAAKLSKEKTLPGFRPGKAPVNVVAEAFGQERLLQETVERAVPKFFVRAALDNEVEAITRPSLTIDKVGLEEGLEFTAKVNILPEVTLGDLSAITVERQKISVNDEDVEKELKYLAKTRSKFIEIASPAKKGNTVKADFKILINEKVIEGGEGKDYPITIGEGLFVPGFEDKLTGIKAEEEREFEIEFPKDYGQKDLQGKKARAWVRAKAVQKRVLPEMNDEFAKGLGKFEDLDNLKYVLKSNLISERERKEEERRQGEMTQKLAAGAKFSRIPEALIEKEIDHRLAELAQMLSWQKMTIDDYLQRQGKKIAEVREGMKETAEKSVRG
jgi:trigger factor